MTWRDLRPIPTRRMPQSWKRPALLRLFLTLTFGCGGGLAGLSATETSRLLAPRVWRSGSDAWAHSAIDEIFLNGYSLHPRYRVYADHRGEFELPTEPPGCSAVPARSTEPRVKWARQRNQAW